MEKTVGVGYENFDELIRDNIYYVDKTELLYEAVAQTKNKVTLFTRPRRFGKTLTMSMMESFFDIRRDSKNVFSGTNIVINHPEFCAEWMNQYPVLSATMRRSIGASFQASFPAGITGSTMSW